jgi:hypothetical protein
MRMKKKGEPEKSPDTFFQNTHAAPLPGGEKGVRTLFQFGPEKSPDTFFPLTENSRIPALWPADLLISIEGVDLHQPLVTPCESARSSFPTFISAAGFPAPRTFSTSSAAWSPSGSISSATSSTAGS